MNSSHNGLTPEFLARVCRREKEALGAFFDHYFQRVYAYAARLVGNSSDAEDVTQVTFMKIYQAIHTIDSSRDPSPWVFAVASNAIRDHWRSRAHRQAKLESPLESALTNGVPSEDGGSQSEAMRVLDRALNGMPETLQQVVWLRDYEGLEYAQIAQTLSINEAAARKRHSRALQVLRSALKPKEPVAEERRS